MEIWQTGIGLAIFLVLIFQRWFWFVALTMGSLAAGVESLANIMHLHITSAFGYIFLMLICWSFATAIAGGYPSSREKVVQEGCPLPAYPDWSPR
jgi:hypothetical protein